MIDQRFFGYKHWTLEEIPRCFYVGKGQKGRSHSTGRRNHKWYAIVKRYGLRVEVCIGPVTNEEACLWEIDNISSEKTFSTNYSHNADIKCNFTKGGEGTIGRTPTPNETKKRSLAGIRRWAEPGARENQSAKIRKACQDPTIKDRRSKSQLLSWNSDERRAQISIIMKTVHGRRRFQRKSHDWFLKTSSNRKVIVNARRRERYRQKRQHERRTNSIE